MNNNCVIVSYHYKIEKKLKERQFIFKYFDLILMFL